jgi:transcriptional regulator with XRE-family HTH domain
MPDRNTELADFLRRARSQCDASRAGLPADGRVRRVHGLRREEVAFLAGVSTDYYARLEQGRRIVPSPSVVDAIGRALGLDQAGRVHLADLIGSGTATPQPRARAVQRVRPGVHQLLEALDGVPVLVLGRRADVLAQNRLGKALFTDFERFPAAQRNYARWLVLDVDARSLFVDWGQQARTAVENLRLEAGNDPADRATAELIAELREASPEFSRWWDEHRVNQRTYGAKQLRHPLVGDLTVAYETLTLPGDPDTTLFAYSAEPASPSQRALSMLASWSLTTG